VCGITGLVRLDGLEVSSHELLGMTDAISHRGPDGQGQWIENNIGFGHRRLAILDLTDAGRQPMFSSDKRFVLVYNGEIYNYKKLKVELSSLGYQFMTRTDSEVLLAAFQEWGIEAIHRFNGMFSFAIFDRREQRLFLGRDRFGIKPLYISKQGSSLAFASEQKAITSLASFQRKLDLEGVFEYLNFQNLLTSRTLNKDIQILPAGHFATLDLSKGETNFKITQYWDFDFHETSSRQNHEEYREELDRLFVQAVNRQLVSDVELGSYLSGGMDSASISAIVSRSIPNLKTFTCGFDLTSASRVEQEFDEREAARALSSFFKTEHHDFQLNARDMERALDKIVWHLEEPRVGQSYPNYYAAKLASSFVKVVMSGTGGDELFAGYPWRYFGNSDFTNLTEYTEGYFNYWRRLLTDEELQGLTNPIRKQVKDIDARQIFRDILMSNGQEPKVQNDYINLSLRFEAKTFLHGLLVVEDKLSMAHGLEARIPFLDNDLVDFAMRCPVELKIHSRRNFDGAYKGSFNSSASSPEHITRVGKQILREAMEQYLPKETLNGKKQGFSGPDASWFQGESLKFVKDRLSSAKSPIFDYLDFQTTQILLDQHLNGQQNRRLLIWSLLNLNQLISSY